MDRPVSLQAETMVQAQSHVALASGDARAGRRTARLALLVFVAVALVTAVAVVAAVDCVLFDVAGLEQYLVAQEVDSPRAKLLMAARYRDAKILYLGDSRAVSNLDPDVVSAACRCGPGYNAGFSSADPFLTAVVFGHLVARMSPELVVISVSQWWLSDGADISVLWPARQILGPWDLIRVAGYPGAGDLVSAALAVPWRAYRYRTEIHATMMEGLGSHRLDFRRGFTPKQTPRSREQLAREALVVKQRGFSKFDLNGQRMAVFRGLLDDVRRRGIRAVVTVPPLHPVALRLVEPEVSRFLTVVTDVSLAAGARVEDFTRPHWIDETDFADNVHLNEQGARKLSRHLGDGLQ
jgi:hypothetical protein